MIKEHIFFLLLIGSVAVLSVALKKLTLYGAIAGYLLALGVYIGSGITGTAMLGAFFIIGTAATSHKQYSKEQARIAAKNEQKRNAGQVLANGGLAGLLGAAALLFPQKALLLQTMIAASMASATADTVSSELGVVYGRKFFNIRTLQRDTCGLDGVVSWEGTLLGALGSIIIAVIYGFGFGFSRNMLWILVAGTIGNLSDSYLGATLERSGILNNNAVNFLNTLIAALIVLLASFLMVPYIYEN